MVNDWYFIDNESGLQSIMIDLWSMEPLINLGDDFPRGHNCHSLWAMRMEAGHDIDIKLVVVKYL